MELSTKIKKPNRNKKVQIRFKETELQIVKDLADEQGVTLSDLVRMVLLNTKPSSKKASPERRALITALGQLGKIGGNINQIARAINEQRKAGVPIDFKLDELYNVFRNLKAISDDLINRIKNGH